MYTSFKNNLKLCKMAEKPREETRIELEWDIVDACNGFSIDFGLKLIYFSSPEKNRKKHVGGKVSFLLQVDPS